MNVEFSLINQPKQEVPGKKYMTMEDLPKIKFKDFDGKEHELDFYQTNQWLLDVTPEDPDQDEIYEQVFFELQRQISKVWEEDEQFYRKFLIDFPSQEDQAKIKAKVPDDQL